MPPPEIELCNRYLDFVWYFLKSTDSLLYLQMENMVFSEPNNLGEIRFDIEFESPWSIMVSGNVDEKFIIIGENDDAIIIDEIQQTPARVKNEIYGTLRPTAAQLEKISRMYFSISGFCWDDHLR